jgi:hypothetical protein
MLASCAVRSGINSKLSDGKSDEGVGRSVGTFCLGLDCNQVQKKALGLAITNLGSNLMGDAWLRNGDGSKW